MTMTLWRSNSLADLAAKIKQQHAGVEKYLTRSVEYAMDAGDLLIEAKQQLEHGQWLPWLAESVEISESTARRYMRLARNRGATEANRSRMTDLTVNGVLAALSNPSVAVKTAEAEDDLEHRAEKARRQVIIDAIKDNAEAVETQKKRIPARARHSPEPEWLKELFADLTETVTSALKEYELAVECGDHASAFVLVTWLHDLSADLRSMGERAVAPRE
jgi:hypothetical protein